MLSAPTVPERNACEDDTALVPRNSVGRPEQAYGEGPGFLASEAYGDIFPRVASVSWPSQLLRARGVRAG